MFVCLKLNFPIGDKFDLDGTEAGERWGLPMHLLDAIFFAQSGRASSFDNSGTAVAILERIASAIQRGIAGRHLQRLPHGEFSFHELIQSIKLASLSPACSHIAEHRILRR